MNAQEKKASASLINELLLQQDEQGYNVRSDKTLDYSALIINELNVLENLSCKYDEELFLISRFIRNNFLGKSSNYNLYILLHRINVTMKLMAEAICSEIFWNSNTVILYALLICNGQGKLATEEMVASLIDDLQLIGAKKIISEQWGDVFSSTDGEKTFMDIFDDVFVNAIEKYPDKFIYELKDTDVLCRMVTLKDCDEQRFIPLPESVSQNRWNPPGKAFLYMSYGNEPHQYNAELTLEERVCLLECRTEPDTDCSFCNFKPVNPGKILDLSFNDVELSHYRHILGEFKNRSVASILQEMFLDEIVMNHMHDERYIKREIKKRAKNMKGLELTTAESIVKQYLKMICSCIYFKVDGTDQEKENAYRSFHMLAAYLNTKGITGIIYPCTRDEKIKGKNIVLFEPSDAEPIIGSIRRYHYKG